MGTLKLSRVGAPVRSEDKLTEADQQLSSAIRKIGGGADPAKVQRLLAVHAELLGAIAREERRRRLRREGR
ncbi:hypothetical protein FJ938_22065 [Mesorhizobium sp. B2-4-14]|uniref:hypothetical protein n=1 Tax=Mesorhizobium sp. B2-4-14 TaxID=2589935 RepID=UPI0011293DDF|nr:hypothetical protein [Mesorhizobium sp. B2-4-14]TPL00681.1 hypothetical protein FJ938_22065 [Mesorhizobium sp. B2-4-14]